ncbi:flagellar basal-body rod protein FlgG [Deltaproteobacteria bacterium]|nr:flagellar basal-body rod protein FlgG [Deltaproteobacteria bacterium]
MRALSTAASGMRAYQTKIDNIANNLANANTTGFKKVREHFEDLMYQDLGSRGGGQGASTTNSMQVGSGVRLASLTRDASAGDAQVTNNQTDMMVAGAGYFVVETPDGEQLYTRDGSFVPDAEGNLVNAAGYRLAPGIQLPEGTSSLAVASDGSVTATVETSGGTEDTQLGQIELARFRNPSGLEAMGRNMFRATTASGEAETGAPGEDGMGPIVQGSLEGSNVDVAEELVGMITAQRSYELSSKVIQAADEMMSTAVNLRR